MVVGLMERHQDCAPVEWYVGPGVRWFTEVCHLNEQGRSSRFAR